MGQKQSPRVAAGVMLLHQFEVTDNVMIVDADSVKLFEEVEPDVRFKLFGCATEIPQVVINA